MKDYLFKIRKELLVILLVILLTPLFFINAGCWDMEELEDLAYILVIGIDYLPEEEKFEVTTVVSRPTSAPAGQGGEGGDTERFRLVTTQGVSLSTALEQQDAFLARRAYYGHNTVIVIGERLAREGLHLILDRLVREREVRLGNYIYVTTDNVREVLQSHAKIEEGLPQFLRRWAEGTLTSLAPVIDLRTFLREMLDEGVDSVLTLLSIRTEMPISPLETELSGQISPDEGDGGSDDSPPSRVVYPKISGSAVFKGDRLAGFLDQGETKGLLYMRGEITDAQEIIEDPLGNPGHVILTVFQSRPQIAPFFRDGSPAVILEVSAESEIC